MKNLIRPLLFLAAISPAIALAHIPLTLPNGQAMPSLAPMLADVTPAVVNITVLKPASDQDSDDSNNTPGSNHNTGKIMGVGSGVIFDAKDGLIITNAHVVHDESLMIVTLKDGRHCRANLIAKDDGFDIAIIHITAEKLHALPFGDSDALQVGDFVAAIGSPFGLTQSLSFLANFSIFAF